jgi:hypothetical protein
VNPSLNTQFPEKMLSVVGTNGYFQFANENAVTLHVADLVLLMIKDRRRWIKK